MDEFIGKLSLYDYLVRLIAGGITILGAYYSDLVGMFWNLKNISAIAFILCSYGIGIVLEEISYIWKVHWKSNKENEIAARIRYRLLKVPEEKYSEYDFEKCKRKLLKDNREEISDEPLAHFVMADSLKIACILLAFLKIISIAISHEREIVKAVINIVILIVLSEIFYFRTEHYEYRQRKRVIEYCVEKGYPDIYMNKSKENCKENK